MTSEQRNAAAVLSEQRTDARSAVEAGRYKEALDSLNDGALNAFLLQDVSALGELGALAREVVEKAGDGYVKARGDEVNRRVQSYRSRSWPALRTRESPAGTDEVDSITETPSQSR
jgi:hypothetical protein